jgi:hypothetical protein
MTAPESCPKCGAQCTVTDGGKPYAYLCNSHFHDAGAFRQSDDCRIAELTARCERAEGERDALKNNGACAVCHGVMEAIGYVNCKRELNPEVVWQCKCGRYWRASPEVRRDEFLATNAALLPPAEKEPSDA